MTPATAVIPNWNRRDLLAALLGSLARQTRPFADVVVVDNGSGDGSPEEAGRRGARVIRLDRNHGFARAVNLGIAAARTPYVAVLNNDVELEPDWLERLSAALDASPEAWFATGKILNHQDRTRLDGAFDLLCRGGCAWRAGHGREDGPAWNRARRVEFTSFTAALFRAGLFERIGPLDERFETYLEDIDFCLRCASAGLAGLYVPGARACHRGSATLGAWHADAVRRIARNQLLLVAKHYPAGWLPRFGWPVLTAQLLWCLLAFRHGAGLAALGGKLEAWRRFGEFRRAQAHARAGAARPLAAILEESERELLKLQQAAGMDPYWRIYFGLTGCARASSS